MPNNLNVSAATELYKVATTTYFIDTDEGRYDTLIDYFTDDATFLFLGQTFSGREQIKAFMERERGEDKLMHHVTSATASVEDGKLIGRTQLLVHFDRWEVNEAGEKINTKGLVSGVYKDEFVIENNTCKFKKRVMQPAVVS